ncbi:MAG: colanic acid biosynthesis acetyltransferase WcaF [Bryobacterales bacterium]|nr:colanic acid biosynthesis acetyltransferase WcaF [Bryobacterales bacterium]
MMVDLSRYNRGDYDPGRGPIVRSLWFFVGLPLLRAALNPSTAVRVWLLRLFGAKVGRGTTMKPGMRVKYPWRLKVGDFAWIGEDAWIDNLALVSVGNNAVISQGAYLCTGNHDWARETFDLRTGPILLEDGSWVGARAFVGPNVVLERCAVAAAGSVVTRSIPAFEIHAGNPATFVKHRVVAGDSWVAVSKGAV